MVELMQTTGMRPDAAAYLTATLGMPSRQTRTAVKVAEALAAVPSVEAALSTSDDAMVHIDALLPPKAGAVVKGAIEHIADEMWKDDPTDLNNLALFCSRHHHDVHEGGQPLEQADGETGGWQVRRGLPHPGPPRRLEGREEEAVGERRSQDHQTGKPTSWVVSCS